LVAKSISGNPGRNFGLLHDQLVCFMVIWHISPGFGMLYLEKFNNPAPRRQDKLNLGLFTQS
jgi:hypothetical protein